MRGGRRAQCPTQMYEVIRDPQDAIRLLSTNETTMKYICSSRFLRGDNFHHIKGKNDSLVHTL